MKKLFMFVCTVAFLGCAQGSAPAVVSQNPAPILSVVASSLHKPTLKQVVPRAALKTPSRALTAKVPPLKLQKRFVIARVSPSAI